MEGDLVFFVNGQKVRPDKSAWEDNLVLYLRQHLRLTGTKAACGSGYCGACTVLVSSYDDVDATISHAAMNACLLPLFCLHGKAVTTVEAIGSVNTSLHPIQSRLVEAHGIQCGYCTPGMVMSMYALLRSNPLPNRTQAEDAIQGNLCRCTGYRPIIEGFKSFCQECPMGADCCQTRDKTDTSADDHERAKNSPYDPSQDVIFPSELQVNAEKFRAEPVIIDAAHVRWYQARHVRELLELVDNLPEPSLVYGYTYNARAQAAAAAAGDDSDQRVIISCSNVRDLNTCSIDEDGLTAGAAVTITHLEHSLTEAIATHKGERFDPFSAILEMIKTFGGRQLRNMLTVGDHLASWSRKATLIPVLIAAGCDVTVANIDDGERTMRLRDVNAGNGLTLRCNDVIINLKIPRLLEGTFLKGFSIRPRRTMAPPTLVAGLRLNLDLKTHAVTDACFVFGGATPHILSASKASQYVMTTEFKEDICHDVIPYLKEDLGELDAGSDTEQRLSLAAACFLKFYCFVMGEIKPNKGHDDPSLTDVSRHIQGTQVYGMSGVGEIGKPLPHYTAPQQATGEAEYVDDMPHAEGELKLALVLSKVAHANIVNVDVSAALAMPGVMDYISSSDVPGTNVSGPYVAKDEEIFATKKVSHVGTVIGAILADTAQHAHDAAQAVFIEYDILPHILSIKDAISAQSFFDVDKSLCNGDPDRGFEEADCVVEGSVETGGQLHVPLEKGACLVIPRKGEHELEVWVTSHDPMMMQGMVSKAVNLPAHRIHTRVKRLGGGFGGKEVTPRRYCLPAAVSAIKHRRPIRCFMPREEDALIMASRHPVLSKYKVGYKNDGTIVAVDIDLFLNGGSSLEGSESVMETAMQQMDGGYKFHNFRIRGRICKTNIISPTAFRGFGTIEGQFVTSSIIRHVARLTGLPLQQVQEKHLLREGDYTHLGDHLKNFYLPTCWDQLLTQAAYHDRKAAIDVFNKEHTWVTRGIDLQPMKMGMEFMVAFLNQGGALVNIYTDGSVLISHGGVEMGQGIHTKLIQVASRTLGIPHTMIHASESASAVVPNATPTVGSMGSDIYGMAVHKACETLNERLAPYKAAKPDGRWEQWVMAAYFNRVSLSATGFHGYPGKESFDFKKESRKYPVYGYYTTGAVCTEVEVDLLTGSHVVLRTDIVMDVGKSLNPAIDIGQIEGAFVQGAGLHTCEEVKHNADGKLLSDNFNTYYIPTVADTPREFNVTLLKKSSNPRAVYSSKGIGEPPLIGSSSVLFAIQNALYAALDKRGQSDVSFVLNSPATTQKIHLLCMKYGLGIV